ncbi:MAG: hypothetical protein R1F52_04915 [Candidatus Nitrosoabyssus spongiisocia]|nr:MAG: hypothetical protein R1F52_04915 [Nitrosopumilaceae archaeon AB1(1)]
MIDIIDLIGDLSYAGIFFLLILLNAAPLLVPPTWIVLASFYVLDPTLSPIVLSLVGATGATIGRFALKELSVHLRKLAGSDHKLSIDAIGKYFEKKRFGYAIVSFLFAATPLPSNMLFVAYGIMKAKGPSIYFGFWCGRLISYYILISVSNIVLVPFIQLFEDRILGIIVIDILGICVVIFFLCINWITLIQDHKLKFVRPRLWRF